MLETYQNEITRKRKSARIFWLIVFVCSLFLYFFFQGYYPDVRVGLQKIFSESGSENHSNSDLIRSFGIINVRTLPLDANITLGENSYGNNEKRMSDYGDYMMHIEKPGYLPNNIEFKIDREKPFFIEKISLLPLPRYKKLDGMISYFHIGNSESLIQTATGLIGSGTLSHTGITFTGTLTHIGGKYFETSTGVLTWNGTRFVKSNSDIANFIETCENIEWKYGLFYCAKSKSLLTETGKYMTGILNLDNHLIIQSGALIEIKKGSPGKVFNQTGGIKAGNLFVNKDIFLIGNTGNLISPSNHNKNISTILDSVSHISTIEETTIIVGKKDNKTELIIRHIGDPIDRERIITLPSNLSYSDIEFAALDGNLIFKSPKGILFIYRGSHHYQWIVEGDIISFTESGAVYKKDNVFWYADWSEIVQL
ncbi:hypothetical protein K2X92_00500 [Candidatus Gracilibacteria bacterium]|nr:hypothetical protein [Candidatus Gracilibacteria bacterium]